MLRLDDVPVAAAAAAAAEEDDAVGGEVGVLEGKVPTVGVVAEDKRQEGELVEDVLLDQLGELSAADLAETMLEPLLKVLACRRFPYPSRKQKSASAVSNISPLAVMLHEERHVLVSSMHWISSVCMAASRLPPAESSSRNG